MQRLVGEPAGAMLRRGSSGPAVSRLQQALVGAGAQVEVDGSFGPATHAAVVEFQKGAGLAADGIVGPKTSAALGRGGGGGRGEKAPPEKVVLLKTKLAMLQARIAELGGKPDAKKEASATPTVEPTMRGGWLDDAIDTVGDVASSVADTVGDVASSAADTVGSAADWAEDKAGQAASAVTGAVTGAAAGASSWVEEKVGDAGQWIGEKADEAKGFVDGVVDGLGQQLGSLGEDLSGLVGPLVGPVMDGIAGLGSGVGLDPAQVDDLIAKVDQALAGLDSLADNILGGEEGVELGGGTKGGKTDYSAPAKIDSRYTFSDADYNSLLATLTARQAAGEEIGSCRPTVTYTLNGVNEGTGLPDDEKVTSAFFTVVDNISLPDWANVSQAQPAQQKAWETYAAGVGAHENLHAADDKGFLGNLHVGCLGKTVQQAVDFVNKQITDSNNQSPLRDTASPPPTLKPAGTTKVP